MGIDFLNQRISRREFLKKGLLIFLFTLGFDKINTFAGSTAPFEKEASFYKNIDPHTVKCQLCPHGCVLKDGQRSFCRVREPKDGKLYSLVYGLACAVHIDPIEKKPLFHFLPGSPIYSIATAGCNFRCKFCQNWSISQYPPEETYNYRLSPQDIVNSALDRNCPSIAYTYTEPSIFYEYMLDTAKLAKRAGLKNMYHSNGYLNSKPVEELSLYLDGANIDLKSFNQSFYSEVCSGYLDVVLNTLKILKQNHVWVEITNLVIPTLNDNLEEIRQMCLWIKENLGKDTPIHFSRFWPQYKLTHLYPTPVDTLEKARSIALDVGLDFVYIGNVFGHPAENTYCPGCKRIVIERRGFSILAKHIDEEGICKFCGYALPGIWS
ncbi:MAG: AmmeMemoRadiSam system radical SAM enzyme [Candidatus Omnitrophica bacterium]|nr:AmmeMemoRadiSam system radical SAM enzyme [Candidatus Omnitrophota bacterium]MCM8799656.1 AmmeMemoRadiSam system radical SAM enzyme [Candidatus Omnitrophota bacterium]